MSEADPYVCGHFLYGEDAAGEVKRKSVFSINDVKWGRVTSGWAFQIPAGWRSAVTVVCGNSLASLMGATDSKRRAECQHAPLLLCLENRMWSLFQMEYISMCCIFLEAWILVAIRKEIITSATINEPPFCLYMVIRNFYSYSLGYDFYNLAVFCNSSLFSGVGICAFLLPLLFGELS